MVTAIAEAHPRIRARREALRRTDERRKWIRTAVLLALLVVPIAVLALARTSLLDVDLIAVEGTARADPDTLTELADVAPGVALVDVDLAALERRVERHPWVATARARRDWPGTIQVDVVERVPVATAPLDDGSAWLLLDLDAMVLEAVPQAPSGLPVVQGVDPLVGPGRTAGGLGAAVTVADAIPVDLAAWVVAVEEGPSGQVVVHLLDGVIADMGTPDRLADKLVALATLLTRVQTDCIVSFNVQAPDAPVVTRCAAPAAEAEPSAG